MDTVSIPRATFPSPRIAPFAHGGAIGRHVPHPELASGRWGTGVLWREPLRQDVPDAPRYDHENEPAACSSQGMGSCAGASIQMYPLDHCTGSPLRIAHHPMLSTQMALGLHRWDVMVCARPSGLVVEILSEMLCLAFPPERILLL